MNILAEAIKTHGLTVRQASAELGISVNTLVRLRGVPKLPLLYEWAVKGWLAEKAKQGCVAFRAKIKVATGRKD